MKSEFTIKELADLVNGEVVGDSSLIITGFGPLVGAGEKDLSFLAKVGKAELLEETGAAAVLVPLGITEAERTIVRVKDPYLASAIIQNHMLKKEFVSTGVHPTAVIGTGCSLPEQVSIGPQVVIGNGVTIGDCVLIAGGVVIGDDVVIGDHCEIRPNVTIENGCELGRRVIIHGGTVIGSDGYGYATDEQGQHVKRPQLGIVRIGDDVEIGANCCVDRATFGVTWIKSGTKIDNLVQLGHNVELGENSLLVAQVGIAGSTIIGRNVVFGGKAAASGHQYIGDRSMIAGKSGVHGDQPPGSMLAGTPAIDAKQWFKAASLFGKLPEIIKDIKRIKKELSRFAEKK